MTGKVENVAVDFDATGKTSQTYAIGTVITEIVVTATGYVTDNVDDHTIVAETVGDENKAQINLEIKENSRICSS